MATRGTLKIDPVFLGPVALKLAGDCPTYARSHVMCRGHEIILDEPPERDGTDQGAAPTETFVAALIGVTNIILRRLGRRDGLAIHHVEVTADATLDRRGVWLAQALPNAWPEVRQTVRIRTDASDEQLALWQEDLPRFSPLHSLLLTAGTKLEIDWIRV
ncbi:OsmC family protein [Lacibacterium aquatile]|uniref:OsmC family protein n=1 Tax=Lacibacterium aquatile TaxID=1168082 RepID=A0ABW5DKF2_9PROT